MSKLFKICVVILLCPLLAIAQPVLTSDGVLREIARTGAHATVKKLYGNGDAWREFLANVGRGDPTWLKVAVKLHVETDAGASEQIIFAVGEALEHQPREVLTAALPELGIDVCGAPDVDDQRYETYELSMKAIMVREEKLNSVTQPQLAKVRERCTTALEAAKLDVSRFFGKTK